MRLRNRSLALVLALLATPTAARAELRVCADPNNLPFSNDKGEGFENRLAELIGSDLGETVTYVWWAQRRGFIRKTLNAGQCDVIMGMPVGLDMIATTQPYYRSSYVFVTRADRDLKLRSITDPQLRQLRIGVHLIGNDGFNTPPAHALGEQGIVDNVSGYLIYGDYRSPNPPSALIEAVARGKIDVAAAWGPLAGYFAKQSGVPLRMEPIAETNAFPPFAFQYAIALAVRKDDAALKARLDDVIARERPQIHKLLAEYGVPLVDEPAALAAGPAGP